MMSLRTALAIASCALATSASAQVLPSEPLTFGGGRVVLGGDVAASIGPVDDGFFNYGDYEHSTLREFRVGITAEVKASSRLSLLADVRSENLEHVRPFALFARIRPFPNRRLDIQAGRIPPTFGRFSRQAYSRQNPLIGYPLAYQYLTSLRPDALPASADELLLMRARGWRSNFTIGDPLPAPGVPLVTALRWDTGVQVTTGWKAVTVTGAVTSGTTSNPRVSDDNGGKQVVARVSIAPADGLDIGGSFARGAFLSRSVLAAAGVDDQDFVQIAHGVDVEYGRGRWLTRAEAISSQWRVPLMAARTVETLRAFGGSVEGRYTLMPGLYVAARADHLAFNRVQGTVVRVPWEAPVTRLEVGGGYYLMRNVIVRSSLQFNHRDAGRVTQSRLLAGQLLFWF
jgi:hypothetical protein